MLSKSGWIWVIGVCLWAGRVPAHPVIEPEMVDIPAGVFTMGCVAGRDDVTGRCSDIEKPARQVRVAAFRIAKYEVTFDQWDACTAAGACPYVADEGWGRGWRPVINVSWHDAQTYLRWLSSQTGKRYRLPSEAEWEYAARGGRNGAYPWGDSISCGNARYGHTMEGNPCGTDRTQPVGCYAPNGYGLHDTAGNVWEWVQDAAYRNYRGAPANSIARRADSNNPERIMRGGSWYYTPKELRSANRSALGPDNSSFNIGFRVAEGQ